MSPASETHASIVEPPPPAFSPDFIFEDLGPVAKLTLNRPNVMNALSIRCEANSPTRRRREEAPNFWTD